MEDPNDNLVKITSSILKVIGNDDLLTKILLGLPVKSLLRFKSVSKPWQALITNDYFKTLRNPDPDYISGLICPYPTSTIWSKDKESHNPRFSLIPLKNANHPIDDSHFESTMCIPNLSHITILNSCHGLLLCSGYNEFENMLGKYHILNPTTKQFYTLPNPHLDSIEGLGLAYEPSVSLHYKVVSVWSSPSEDHDQLHVEIYSSETKTWRASGEKFTTDAIRYYLSGGVHWNGSINWLNAGAEAVYFNLDEERFGIMPMPPASEPLFYWYGGFYFGESHGHLHFTEILGPANDKSNVYEMKKDHSEWFLKYRVDLNTIISDFPEMSLPDSFNRYYTYSVSSIIREGNDEGSFMVLYVRGKFVRYNFVDKSYKIIYEYTDTMLPEGSHSFIAYPYIESLSSIQGCRRHSLVVHNNKDERGRGTPTGTDPGLYAWGGQILMKLYSMETRSQYMSLCSTRSGLIDSQT